MTERARNRPSSSEEWSNHITDISEKGELGTPELFAVADFLNLQRLYGQIGKEPYNAPFRSVSGESNLTLEDRKNLILQRIARLEHTIEQNSARIAGYACTYSNLSLSVDNMCTAASEEAQAKFPNQKEKQVEYIQEVYEHTLDEIAQSVFEKQNLNL